MNPRLSPEWLRYLVVGRRPPGRRRLAVEDRPDDALRRLRPVAPGVDAAAPARAVDAVPRRPRPRSPRRWAGAPSPSGCCRTCRRAGGCEILDDVGHFVHIEQPDLVADDGARPRRAAPHERASTMLTHNRVDARPAPPARRRRAGRCCCCTGSARRRPTTVPPWLDGVARAGRRPRLHRPRRVDDPARRRLHGRDPARRRRHRPRRSSARPRSSAAGSAPTSPCMLAGARPADVVGAVLADGPGLAGGATFPTSQSFFALPPAERPARPVRARRAEPRPAPARLRRGVRPPGARRLAARRADHRGRRVPPAVAGGRRRRARRRPTPSIARRPLARYVRRGADLTSGLVTRASSCWRSWRSPRWSRSRRRRTAS